jgi:hypothetical protein
MRPIRAERPEPGALPTEQRGRAGVTRGRLRLLGLGAVVLVAVLVLGAASPPVAQALPIAPIGPDPLGLSGGLLGGVTGGLAKVAVGGFDAIVKALFAPVAKFITTELIGWLVAVPNLTQGNVSQLEQTVEAMGGGLLGAIATISTIRYWAAGFAGGGDSGFAALEGLTRTVGAALFLAIWPWLFDTAVGLTNLFTSSLLGSGAVVHSVSHLLAAGLGAGIGLNFTPIGLFLNIAIAVAASLLFLVLLLVKIVVSISTILVFVGMPLAVVVWPVVPWIARAAMRAFAVCLLVPVMWALCFAASAAVSLDAITFNAGTVMNTLLEPLVAIVLLWVMLRLPVHLAKVAMLGAAPLGGGFASRAVSFAAGSQLRDTARQHLPAWAGGHPTSSNEQPAQAETRTGTRLRQAATLAGASATGGATSSAAAAAGGGASTGNVAGAGGSAGSTANSPGTGANGRSYTSPPTAQTHAAAAAGQGGLQTPSFREQDFANETFEARFRERTSPVSAEQAKAALQTLPADTQRGVGQLVSEHGAGAREHLAYQALGDWSPGERKALRTLAAASPEIRARALGDTGDQREGWTTTDGTDHGAAGEQQRSSAPVGGTQPASTPEPPSTGSPSQPAPVDLPDPAAPLRRTPTPPREPGDGPAPQREER